MNKPLLGIRAARVLVVLGAIWLLFALYMAFVGSCFIIIMAIILGPIVLECCRRSNPVRAATYSLIVTTLAVGSYVGYYAYDATPSRLFKRFVMADMPASVQIMDGKYYGARDPSAFLHFRLDKRDFGKLLATRKYNLEGTYSPPAGGEPTTSMTPPNYHPAPFAPDWWRPEQLHEPTLYETTLDNWPSDHETIWVNAERTEVYFVIVSF